MNRSQLLESVASILDRSDFLSSKMAPQGNIVFDLIGRREEDLLIIRVLMGRDQLESSSANDMKILGSALNATPIIVIPSTKDGNFQDGVLYLKHGIAEQITVRMHDPFVYYLINDIDHQREHQETIEGPDTKSPPEHLYTDEEQWDVHYEHQHTKGDLDHMPNNYGKT